MSRETLALNKLWQQIKNARMNIRVSSTFKDQVKQIDTLLGNDKTGIVSTIYNFMVESATVPMKIETQNESLNKLLREWQINLLNRDVNIDIPGGLRALSTENYRERWRSSLLALNVIWGEEKLDGKTWIVPKKMWFLNGGAVSVESNGALNERKFFLQLNKKKKVELKKSDNESVFIRKPFTSWHEDEVIPYFVQRGTMYKSLMKDAITQKQADVIEAIMPILLELRAGSDKLLEEGNNPSKEEFKKLKDQFIEAKARFEESGSFGDMIASLRHDVNLNYLIPDLVKVFDERIIKTTDRDLLSSLGMIELQGFSSTRQEAILNPKVLIEEVTDAVLDWSALLEDVMIEMLERNKSKHPTLSKGTIRVIPGTIKAFLTEDMKAMLRSLYDRGTISKQSIVEDVANINFEVEVERRTKEDKRNLQTIMKPPVIQNLEQFEDVELDDNNLENQDKKPGTPEADNFINAIMKNYLGLKKLRKKKVKSDKDYSKDIIQTPDELPEKIKKLSEAHQLIYFLTYNFAIEDGVPIEEAIKKAEDSISASVSVKANKEEFMAPYDEIDDLPDNVKNVLPVPAQLIWLKVFNSILKETGDEDRARKGAWSKVSEKYEKVPNKKKWIKKAKLEDYKNEMSSYTYKFFKDVYNTALEQSDSNDKAIKTALAVIESVCTKNKSGIWVKNKTITKNQLQALDSSDFIGKVLDLEIKEEKLKLLKTLNEEQ
jgi:cation transport regulator